MSSSGGVRSEEIRVTMSDGKVIKYETCVDCQTGLDVDPNNGTFRTREETISLVRDIYDVGKVDLATDLEKYNQWIRSNPDAAAKEKSLWAHRSPESEPKAPAPSPLIEAVQLKNEGNEALKSSRFRTAVKLYSRAMKLAPRAAVLWANRSEAHLRLGRWDSALADAKNAVQLLEGTSAPDSPKESSGVPSLDTLWAAPSSVLERARFRVVESLAKTGKIRAALELAATGLRMYQGTPNAPLWSEKFDTIKRLPKSRIEVREGELCLVAASDMAPDELVAEWEPLLLVPSVGSFLEEFSSVASIVHSRPAPSLASSAGSSISNAAREKIFECGWFDETEVDGVTMKLFPFWFGRALAEARTPSPESYRAIPSYLKQREKKKGHMKSFLSARSPILHFGDRKEANVIGNVFSTLERIINEYFFSAWWRRSQQHPIVAANFRALKEYAQISKKNHMQELLEELLLLVYATRTALPNTYRTGSPCTETEEGTTSVVVLEMLAAGCEPRASEGIPNASMCFVEIASQQRDEYSGGVADEQVDQPLGMRHEASMDSLTALPACEQSFRLALFSTTSIRAGEAVKVPYSQECRPFRMTRDANTEELQSWYGKSGMVSNSSCEKCELVPGKDVAIF